MRRGKKKKKKINIQRLIWNHGVWKVTSLRRKAEVLSIPDAPRPKWHAWRVGIQTCLSLPRRCIMYRVCSARLLIHTVTSSPKKSSCRMAVNAKLFARCLFHWWYSLYGEALTAIISPSLSIHCIEHPATHLSFLSFSLSLYPYFYYPLLFAPLHRLSVLSIPLIPLLPDEVVWPWPGYSIPF